MARDRKRKGTWGHFLSRKGHSSHWEYCSTSIPQSKQDGSLDFSAESFCDDTREATMCGVDVDIDVEKSSGHGEYCSTSTPHSNQDGSLDFSAESFCDDTREATMCGVDVDIGVEKSSGQGEYCSTSILYCKQDGSVHFFPDSYCDDTREATPDVYIDVKKPSGQGEYCSTSILYCKQDGSVHFSPDSFCDDTREATAHVDVAVEKPDLEAYSGHHGSWWDVEILESTSQNKYLKVHYAGFSEQEDEWIPVTHLRMRSRPCEYSHDYCAEIYPGLDVSVMTRHPDSDEDSEAMWFDARIINVERKPHSFNSCECSFWIALYEIPEYLPHDWSRRKLLPVSPKAVALKEMTTLREARNMYFEEIIAASLPNVVNSPRIWVTDGECWYSSLQSARFVFEISHGLDDFAEYLERVLLYQPLLSEEIRAKKVESTEPAFWKNVAVPKTIAKEITYTELFIKSMELVQFNNPSEDLIQDSDDESGLLPSWNPFEMQSVAPEQVQVPYAEVWEDMRASLEIIHKKGNYEVEFSTIEESSECLDHTVTFDQEIGEVCRVCGSVLLGIHDIWAHDNLKRIAAPDGESDNDEENTSFDYDFASVWDSNVDKLKEQSKSDGGLIFELIPHLAKQMQRHQKQGFLFLWRNLAGQDSNGNFCSPPIKPGGCVLSHAPGIGKTFLIIGFLQSYMKKYPDCRPVIVAPKIMLQPWEKEFRKWNVDIPVYNFDGDAAREQGKAIFQTHVAAGVVHFDVPPNKNMLGVYREAMLLEWLNAPGVLVISYQTFNLLTLGDASMLGTKRILLERPSIVILDEGHYARNNLSQVKEQLMAIKTPLRVMLSGTLFQNNFEELYTCLNLVRPGFVKTFAETAGLMFNVQQGDVENQRLATEWEREAAQVVEAQAAKKLFIDEIGNKIDRGQLAKSFPECLAEGLNQLSRLTTPFVHHYTGGVLREQIPPLREFVVVLQPEALQEKMITKVAERMLEKSNLEREGLLSLVCIHPCLLSKHSAGRTFTDLLPPEEMMQAAFEDPAVGVKTRFVINLLERLQHGQEKEKTLVFCVNLDPLMLLERMLEAQFGWVPDLDTLQIDGKVAADERQSIIERFNDPRGRAHVLLLSTKACGEGVTLTGASRVVFMDVLWNPAVRRQAIHRAFRIGQTKVVHVYSLVVEGSLEEDKYRTMVWKDWKSQTIFHSSDEDHEKVTRSNGFWRMKRQSSEDAVLNELERQDAALDRPAFKHVFRHGGLFHDESAGNPEGRGADARDWLRGIEAAIVPSHSHSMDCDIDVGTPDMDTATVDLSQASSL